MRASPRRERLPLLPLLALAAATFASITIEMLPTAVMPEMAGELGVSHARIGALMSVYALTVVVTAAPLTHVTARIPRRALLTGVLVAYGLATTATAVVPSYELVLASRIAGGVAHGVFWAIAASYTASILPADLLARGLSITLGGGSAAFVLGVPFSAQLAQAIGWRASCGVLAAVTLAIAALLWWRLPRPAGERAAPTGPETPGPAQHAGRAAADGLGRVSADGAERVNADGTVRAVADGAGRVAADRAESATPNEAGQVGVDGTDRDAADVAERVAADETGRAVADGADRAAAEAGRVTAGGAERAARAGDGRDGAKPAPSVAAALIVCGLASLIMTGQYAVASYISPIVTGLAGVPGSWLASALFAYGLAGAIATFATGHAFGRRPLTGTLIALALMAAGAGSLGLTGAAGAPIASLIALSAWGAGMGFAAPLLQERLLAAAPPGFRDIAAALYTSGFNIGIAAGAFIGGALLETAGLAVLPVFLVVALAIAAGLIAALELRSRRRGTRAPSRG